MKKRIFFSVSLCHLAAAVAFAAGAPPVDSGSSPKAPAAQATADEGAPTAHTVGDIYLKSAELAHKKVVLRGRVVKVTSGIVGKTWTHIQDGTGDKAKGTNNIICISARRGGEIGDMVTVVGTVVDNPGNKRYRVMIEDAVFK